MRAGTAVVGSSSSGSALAASGVGGTVGFPPTTAIVAGVAALGGGVALAGGGGGGGGGNGPSIDLTGDWKGTWSDSAGNTGEATFSLTQSGSNITGTVSVTGDDCLTRGNVTGNVSGSTTNLSIQSGAETVTLNGAYNNAAKSLTGRWSYTASSLGCTGDTGDYVAALTGGADVSW